jgi:hypothetical protein
MPLSRCPACGYNCRVLWTQSLPPTCPECHGSMEYIGRGALDSKAKPRLLTRPRPISPPARTSRGR